MSKEKQIHFRNVESQNVGSKPKGLWYGVGAEWIDWIRSNMPEWEEENLFEINIDTSKILLLKSANEVVNFAERYKSTKYYKPQIDWQAVSNEYAGIEISPYQHSLRLSQDWYYSWDVASGCIWDSSGILSIEKTR